MLPYTLPQWFRNFFPNLEWTGPATANSIYLTFDDGPVPEITPWVLEELKKYEALATFFCVGNNVERNPDIYAAILDAGHRVGNHSFSHMKGWRSPNQKYFSDVHSAALRIDSNLFRPPYGQIKSSQSKILRNDYRIIMWSLLSCDYDPGLNREKSLYYLKKYSKPGSVVVFHDSLKARENIMWLLPKYLEFCKSRGFKFATL